MMEAEQLHVKTNGLVGKTPFLIGVAGGTASGKVIATRQPKNLHCPLCL